ncbi:alpha/beta hydrolase [Pelistega ratti]|nr:alpha/beta hydrolase [Pelistega ratti]
MLRKTLLSTSLILATTGVTMAADYAKNPFTLTYEGAITENVAGQVQIHPVKYVQKQTGIEVVANVYTPAHFDANKKYPTIVVAHPNGGVKEQVAGLYAQRLAEQGYITIAFDAAYQGGSQGTPRYTDKPQNRIEDIRAAADFISQYQGVDPDHLGLLGICGGGGYSIKAAQTDKRFKAVATLSMFNSGDARRNGFMRSQKDSIQERLAQIAQARAKEAQTGEVQYTPSFGAGLTPEQVAALPFDLYRQGYEYYAQTHAHPNSQTNSTMDSLADLMEFDVNTNVDLINQPLLMVAGDKADSLYMTKEVFENATGTQNKELFLIPDATHIETYWKPEYVQQAMGKFSEFFKKNLSNTY